MGQWHRHSDWMRIMRLEGWKNRKPPPKKSGASVCLHSLCFRNCIECLNALGDVRYWIEKWVGRRSESPRIRILFKASVEKFRLNQTSGFGPGRGRSMYYVIRYVYRTYAVLIC